MASRLGPDTPKERYGLFHSTITSPQPLKPVIHIFASEAAFPIPDDGVFRTDGPPTRDAMKAALEHLEKHSTTK